MLTQDAPRQHRCGSGSKVTHPVSRAALACLLQECGCLSWLLCRLAGH